MFERKAAEIRSITEAPFQIRYSVATVGLGGTLFHQTYYFVSRFRVVKSPYSIHIGEVACKQVKCIIIADLMAYEEWIINSQTMVTLQ
jgi:hypothetical protein